MIVIDVSTIVGAAGRRDGVPARAINQAFSRNETAVSDQVMAEMTDLLWRDVKDNIYLELPLASGAHTIISSDNDLLVLDPWRGVRDLTPAAYLARATS